MKTTTTTTPNHHTQNETEKKDMEAKRKNETEKKDMEAKQTNEVEKKDMEAKKQLEAKRSEMEKKDEHGEATRFVDALASVKDEMAAIPSGELATINLDIGVATVTALGCMPELRSLREALVAKFGPETGALIERLDLRARAASQANVDYYGAVETSVDDIQEISKRAVDARSVLMAVTQLFVQRKLLPQEVLANIRGTGSFRNQAHDLQHLVSVLRRDVKTENALVWVSPKEIDAAEDAARELLIAIGQREQTPPVVSVAADKRQRAFTLFIRTYEELRAAISHLRWREKDVESILPSLYAGRGGRKKEEDVAPPVVVSPPSPEVVTPTPEPVVVSGPVTPARPGMPGAEPFAPV